MKNRLHENIQPCFDYVKHVLAAIVGLHLVNSKPPTVKSDFFVQSCCDTMSGCYTGYILIE